MQRRYEKQELGAGPEELLLSETIFHNANGYLGVRSCLEEGSPQGQPSVRGMYINGFYDITDMNQAEKLHGLIEEKQTMLNIADTQGICLYIDGELVTPGLGRVYQADRTLDMDEGITIRRLDWESEATGKRVRLTITRMASFELTNLFLIRYEICPVNFSGEIRLVSSHIGEVRNYCDPNDPRLAGESVQYLTAEEPVIKEGISYITAHTSRSGLAVCTAVRETLEESGSGWKIPALCREDADCGTDRVIRSYTAAVRQGTPLRLDKYTIVCDSVRTEAPMAEAKRLCREIVRRGPEYYLQKQKEYLTGFWENAQLEIQGDEETSLAVCYNMYQLIQSVTKDTHGNISAKGLSGEGYEGHYFWDTEMYLQPFFILTAPKLAANLIRYRYTILDYARENARDMGHKKGALYPWRTIMGKECSGYFPSGTAAYHINGDIAYSIISYYLATGDLGLLSECGAEILLETARLWLDMGVYYEGKFQIQEVTGPDEYTCMVDNNYYTNVLAQYNLQWAVRSIELLRQSEEYREQAEELADRLCLEDEELERFAEAAEAMYLPYDEKLGIHPQDDSFLKKKVWDVSSIREEEKPLLLHYHPLFLYRHQVCKQADTVLAHFIREDATDLEKIRRSYEYYEKVTTHDSSLSTCIFSIMAARLGDMEKAYRYFGESAKLDLYNTHKNTKDGIHTANMGGTYMAIVYGFGGLRIKEKGLTLSPKLPSCWKSYRFRILYRGSRFEISVNREKVTVSLVFGRPRKLWLYDREYWIEDCVTEQMRE